MQLQHYFTLCNVLGGFLTSASSKIFDCLMILPLINRYDSLFSEIPHFLFVQALIYHAALLVVCWFATKWVARVIGSSLVAILMIPVACQALSMKGWLTPLVLGLTARLVDALPEWLRT